MAETTRAGALPTTPTDPGGSGSPLDLGWRARARPASGVAHVLGAGAGVFAVLATEQLVLKISSTNPTAPGTLLNAALALVALAAAIWVVGPLRGAAVAVLVLTIPLFWFFVFYANNQPGTGWFRLIYLLSALLYLGLYATLWTKGRAVFLAFALLFAMAYVQFELHRQFETQHPGFEPQTLVPIPLPPLTNTPSPTVLGNAQVGSVVQRTGDVQAVVTIVAGAAFIAVGGLLIRRRYAGAAVAFLVVGAVEGFAAAAVLGPNERSVLLGGVLAMAVGALLALAGSGNGRRGSVWIGVIAIVVSLIAIVLDATLDTLGRAGYYALAAVVLLAVATLLVPALHEPADGGEPPG